MTKFSFQAQAASICLLLTISFGTVFAQTEIPYKNQSTIVSPEKTAPMPFTGLAIKWYQDVPEQTQATISIHFKTNEGWSTWQDIEMESDEKEGEDIHYPSQFIATNMATAFQYKVNLSSDNALVTPIVKNFEFTYLNANDTKTKSNTMIAAITPVVKGFLASGAQQALKVIARSEWGANEDLRIYTDERPEAQLIKVEDNFYTQYASELKITRRVATSPDGKDLTWPLEYPENISKIIIHHTATTKNLDNPAQAIRDIYYWHAISRGWGDIGYNYIIDQQGNIYEGRYGGDGVVGAHAGKANVGSIGIAVLGNFEESEVPEPVMQSLSALIKAKASKYHMDTMGYSLFRSEMLPNVIGHRDVMSTSCPGKYLYAQLPTLRALAKNVFLASFIDKRRPDQMAKYDYEMNEDPGVFQMDGGVRKILSVKVKNTGSQDWDPNTYFMMSSTKASQKYLSTTRASWKSDSMKKTIKSGETAIFQMPLIPSYTGGFTALEVFPMVNGQMKVEKYLSIPVQIKGVNYSYEMLGIDMPKTTLKKGEELQATITIKNTSDVAWRKTGTNKVMIGTENPRDHVSRITTKPDTRLAGLKENIVNPGETAHFVMDIKAPTRIGQYREYFAPVVEGISWLPVSKSYIELFVADTNSGARYASERFNQIFKPAEKKTVILEFENTGEETWETTGTSAFQMDITKNSSLSLTGGKLVEKQVAPGETGHVTFRINAPTKEGIYRVIATPKLGSKNLTLRPVPMYIQVSRKPIVVETKKVSSGAVAPSQAPSQAPSPSQTATPASSPAPTSAESENIKIAIGFKGDPIISADGSFKLTDSGETLKTFAANQKVAVTFENNKYKVISGNTTLTLTGPPLFQSIDSGVLRIDNYEKRPAWKPELNDNTYRGTLEVNRYEDELVVVNNLPLEDYLKGLAEIDATQPYEKIKAIIILARSYAKYYMDADKNGVDPKFPGAPFDLTDDPQRSQFYLGYSFEKRSPTGVRAVTDTAGEVVTYNAAVIKTPYFSSDDGRTRSAQEVWGWTNTPYLVSVEDPGCQGGEMKGHGVGLSGCGAVYFAQQGWDYEKIIKYYFQGVEVEKK